MFCPRCGSPVNESLKYCRNCGLPVSQISTYVATGGTASLTPTQGNEVDEYLTPKQRLALTIVLLLLLPAVIAVIAESLNLNSDVVAIPSVLMPAGIMWAIFHYKAVMRRRRKDQALITDVPPMVYPAQPVIGNAVPQQAQLPPPNTNPLAEASRGSVIEDETRKLREGR